MLLVDSAVLVSILLASFSIRLGYWYLPHSDLVWVIFGTLVVVISIFVRFDIYHVVIHYWNELKPMLDELSNAIDSFNHERLRKLLIQIVPNFKP